MTIDLTADGVTLDKPTRRYVDKVIGGLEKYLSKARRDHARAAVVLTRIDQPHGNKYEAAVTLKMPDVTLSATDTTLNVLAALDIVRAKIIAQMK